MPKVEPIREEVTLDCGCVFTVKMDEGRVEAFSNSECPSCEYEVAKSTGMSVYGPETFRYKGTVEFLLVD